MSAKGANRPVSRAVKAATLVPLALLSAAWTASILDVQPATAGPRAVAELPDGRTVPDRPIEAPAGGTVSGAVALSVPIGAEDAVVAGAAAHGIPSTALAAYQRGAQIIDAADPACHLPWELLAAIGRVESDHGRHAGNVLGADGVSRPGVFGPAPDGSARDRAVGPMQLTVATWTVIGVDADGDGVRNPQDVDDASLAAAVHLCSGTDDLSSRAGQEAALLRYKPSQAYADLVLRIMAVYDQGDFATIPSGGYGGTILSPRSTPAATNKAGTKTKKNRPPAQSTPSAPAPSAPATPRGGDKTGDKPDGKPSGTPAKPGKAKGPVGKVVDTVTEPVGEAVDPVTTPVVETLDTITEALDFCVSQIPIIKTLAPTAAQKCAEKLKGKTEEEAQDLLPSSLGLLSILSWLGL